MTLLKYRRKIEPGSKFTDSELVGPSKAFTNLQDAWDDDEAESDASWNDSIHISPVALYCVYLYLLHVLAVHSQKVGC